MRTFTKTSAAVVLALAAIVVLGVVAGGSAWAQQEHEHGQQAATPQKEHAEEGMGGAMCQRMGGMHQMMQRLMVDLHQHMAMMQGMMAHMDRMPGMHMGGMQMHGEHGGPKGDKPAGPGMGGMQGMQGMRGMMMQMMPDPAKIDDPAVAEKKAEEMAQHVTMMEKHLEQMKARVQALRERAEQLRGQAGEQQ